MVRVEIVIPVYNEEHALPLAIDTLVERLDGWEHDWRVTIVDNASTDATPEVGPALTDGARVFYRRLEQKGRGRALKAAWLGSDADVMAYMDVDLSTDLEALQPLVAALANDGGFDVAVGSRSMGGSRVERSRRRRFLTWGYARLLRLALRVRFSDAQCGFKAVTRQAATALLPLIENDRWFFDTELLVLAEKAGYRVKDIPVRWVEDKDSRVNIVSTILEDFGGVLRLVVSRPWRDVPAPAPQASSAPATPR
ncbi:MAG: glycosyltransferase [Dehalococcoidia bacterium]|nr:glycosyltransferase [Dehalococcoidia bacterium]